MWQRFTERARNAILVAQEIAAKGNVAHVGTEHLLLAILRNEEGVGYQVLTKLGIDIGSLSKELSSAPPEVEPGKGAEPKLTPQSKRVLELSGDEARKLKHNYIGAEHMLLASFREKNGVAGTLLRKAGVTYEKLLEATQQFLGAETEHPGPEGLRAIISSEAQDVADRFARRASRALEVTETVNLSLEANISLMFAKSEAGAKEILSEHLLLGLLKHTDCRASQLLESLGVTAEAIRKMLEKAQEEAARA